MIAFDNNATEENIATDTTSAAVCTSFLSQIQVMGDPVSREPMRVAQMDAAVATAEISYTSNSSTQQPDDNRPQQRSRFNSSTWVHFTYPTIVNDANNIYQYIYSFNPHTCIVGANLRVAC